MLRILRNMRRENLPSKPVLGCAALLIVALACIFGFWRFRSYSNGNNAVWTQMGAPPSDSEVHLSDAYRDGPDTEILVKNKEDRAFLSSTKYPGKWLLVEGGPISGNYYSAYDCKGGIPRPATQSRSFPARQVIECRRYVWNWETISDETFVILVEDGSVFTGRHFPSLQRLFVYVAEGIGLGSLMMILGFLAYRYRERPREERTGQAAQLLAEADPAGWAIEWDAWPAQRPWAPPNHSLEPTRLPPQGERALARHLRVHRIKAVPATPRGHPGLPS